MSKFSKEFFNFEWESDWILRTLIIDHYLYWQGNRKSIQSLDNLKSFLSRHSISHGKKNLNELLRVYQTHKIFVEDANMSLESGLINPEADTHIKEVLKNEYNLERQLETGYTMTDFLWEVYNHNDYPNVELKMVNVFEKLFREILGFQTGILTTGQGTKDERDYLRLSWNEKKTNYNWWLAFYPGLLLKRDDRIAEGLTSQTAFEIRLLSSTTQSSTQYWTLCGIDIGNSAIRASEKINTSFGFGTNFNLILLISLVKLLTWCEVTNQQYESKEIVAKFSNFFYEGQDNPLSTSKGIERIRENLPKIA